MNSSQQRMRLMVDDVGFGEIYGLNSATRFTKEVLDILKFSFQHSSGAVPVQMFSHHESVRPGLYQHVRMLPSSIFALFVSTFVTNNFASETRRPEWHRFALPDEFSTSLATRLTAVIQQKGLPKPWLRHKSNNSVVFRHLCFVFLISRQNSSSGSSAFFSSRKPGWIFSYEPKAKFVLVSGPAWSTGLIWRGP